MPRKSLIYRTSSNREPFNEFVERLDDRRAKAKIFARIGRAQKDNLGDYKGVGEGVLELRIHFGPGYRIYIGLYADDWIILLCAGDKQSQAKDIERAHMHWEDYKNHA